jgi:hypothetical protein
MEFLLQYVNQQIGAPPSRIFLNINGNAEEIRQLMEAMERALYNGPQAIEVRSATGAMCRVIVDRLGLPLEKQ